MLIMAEKAEAPNAKLNSSFDEEVPEKRIKATETRLGIVEEEIVIVRQNVAIMKKNVPFVKRAKTSFNVIMPKNGIIVVKRIVVIAMGIAFVTQRRIASIKRMIEHRPARDNPAGRGKIKAQTARKTASNIIISERVFCCFMPDSP